MKNGEKHNKRQLFLLYTFSLKKKRKASETHGHEIGKLEKYLKETESERNSFHVDYKKIKI